MTNTTDDGRSAEPPVADALGAPLRLTIGIDGFHAMRAAVSAHAAQWGLTEPKLGHLLVVATELASNTIRHAGGSGRLRLWSDGNAVWCDVSDDGPGIDHSEDAGTYPIALNAEGGRGLWLCRQFSDGLTILNRNPGSTVTAFLTIPAASPAT